MPVTGQGPSGLDNIEAVLSAIQGQIDKNSRGLRVLYALMFEGLGDDSLLRERFRAFHASVRRDFAERIAAGQADGSIRTTLDPAAEAAFIVSGMRGVGYQWLLDPDDFDASGVFAHFAAVAVAVGRLQSQGHRRE
ncbi:MAG: TetR family transcriptional regulator C-terminal domain-containing protein [Ilumatobacteraceae bacterium]